MEPEKQLQNLIKTVTKIRKKSGSRPRYPTEIRKRAIKLVDAGYSAELVGQQLQIHYTTINKWRQQQKIGDVGFKPVKIEKSQTFALTTPNGHTFSALSANDLLSLAQMIQK
jgi:transposase-like protein